MSHQTRGFSLLEVVTALFIVGLMTGFLVPLASSMIDANRGLETYVDLARVYEAVVGDPRKGTFGYLGDVGAFPSSLVDLIEKPAGDPPGWNGPYLTDVRVVDGSLFDAFGSPLECYYLRDSSNSVPAKADQFALISRGPDRTSTNTSVTPNTCSTFTGTLPSDGAYAAAAGNPDNVVYPRFMENLGLLDYSHFGRLSININNFDMNSQIDAMVPACPHLYTITVTSVPRDTSDTFSVPYSSPGANTLALRQGLYRVRVTSQNALSTVWEEQVAVFAGATETRELNFFGLDSDITPDQTFRPVNFINFTGAPVGLNQIRIEQTTSPDPVGTVNFPGVGNFTTVNPCGQITVRQGIAPNGPVVELFVYPYFDPPVDYLRRINLNPLFTLTIINRNVSDTSANDQLFVYDTGVLVGVVSSHGRAKVRAILNLRQGNPYTIFDRLGNLEASGSMPAANLTVEVN